VLLHELGHDAEASVPRLADVEGMFYQRRTRGETLQPLNRVIGSPVYGENEVTRPDRFPDPYMGKEYAGENWEPLTMAL